MEEDISKKPEDISSKPGDISNKTIVVLVILTVLISVLGTLTVLREVSDIETKSFKTMSGSGSSSGQVSLTIVPEQEPLPPASTAGYVTFEILPKGE